MPTSHQFVTGFQNAVWNCPVPLGILLLTVVLLDLRRKLSLGSPFVVYPLLTLFPALMFTIPIGYLLSVVYTAYDRALFLLPVWSVIGEIVLFCANIFVGVLRTPPAFRTGEDQKPKNRSAGRQLLHFSIYGGILYTITVLPLTIYLLRCLLNRHMAFSKTYLYWDSYFHNIKSAIMNYGAFTNYSRSGSEPLFGYRLVSDSVNTLSFFLVLSEIILPCALVLLLSLTGLARLRRAAPYVRNRTALYAVLLFVPVANIVLMVRLCRAANTAQAEAGGEEAI